MKCILHIGTEKTGTTTLQHFLYANREALAEKGFGVLTFIGIGNNRRLVSYGMHENRLNDDYFTALGIITKEQKKEHDNETEALFENELVELQKKDCHTILISSEHFHSRCENEEEIQKIKDILVEHFEEIKVLCYLRPQVDMATSLYTTVLRSGSKASFEEFMENHCKVDNIYYNYDLLLERWSNIFGKHSIFPRIFELNKLKNKDLVSDFLNFSNVETTETLHFFNRENESLTPMGQEILRLNNIYPYDFIYEGIPFKKFIYEKANSLFIGKGCSMDNAKSREKQQLFNEINRNVANKWFSSDELFEIPNKKYKQNHLEQSQKQFLEILFSQKQKILVEKVKDTENNNSQAADILREVAISFEKSGDIQAALKVIQQAYMPRPEGPAINQKVNKYKKLLNQQTNNIND